MNDMPWKIHPFLSLFSLLSLSPVSPFNILETDARDRDKRREGKGYEMMFAPSFQFPFLFANLLLLFSYVLHLQLLPREAKEEHIISHYFLF